MYLDPAAELQVARRKIQQLEEVNTHYKTEVSMWYYYGEAPVIIT